MKVLGQLVKTVLDLGSDGLRGEEEYVLGAVGVQELVGDGPRVDGLFEVFEPVLSYTTLLFVLGVVEGLRDLNHVLFYRLHLVHSVDSSLN